MINIAPKAEEVRGDPTVRIPYQVCQHCNNVFWHRTQPFGPEGCGCQRDPSNGPQPGDAVKLVGDHRYSDRYTSGMVEGIPDYDKGKVHVCLGGVSAYRNGSYLSISGGPWVTISPNNFTYVGTKDVWFWKWGRHGRGARKGEHYKLTVSLWELDIGGLR